MCLSPSYAIRTNTCLPPATPLLELPLTSLLLSGPAVLSFASPAAAQTMDHSAMPGMTMPFEPKKPVAETVPVPQPQSEPAPMPEMDHGNMPGMGMNQADTRPPACAPQHAAMGHCTDEPKP